MQTFAKSKIALAVGASLLVLGSGSVYAVAAAPIQRALNPALALGQTAAVARSLVTLGGNVTAGFTINFALINTGAPVPVATIEGDIDATLPLVTNSGTAANDNVTVYIGTTATLVPVTGAAVFNPGVSPNLTDTASIDIAIPAAVAPARFRVLAGTLQFTPDASVAAPVWSDVKIDVKGPVGATPPQAIIFTENGANAGYLAAEDIELAATITTSVGTSVAPAPVVKTVAASATAGVINGLEVDSVVPIDAFANVTNITVTPQDPQTLYAENAVAFLAADATGTLGAPVVPTLTTPPAFKSTVAVTAATLIAAPNWTTGPVADDIAAANNTALFHTGIVGATLPFVVGAGTTPPKYTQVFQVADGTAAPLTIAGLSASATDGVAPTITAAVLGTPVGTTTPLSLTFSEPVQLLTGAASGLSLIREVAENILLGTNSLAALNLNAGGTLTLADSDDVPNAAAVAALGAATTTALTPTAGRSTLVIGGIQTADLTGKTVTVTAGIALQESNDSGFNSAIPALDTAGALSGAVTSVTGLTEGATVTARATTLPAVTIAFSDTTATAATTVADATKIGLITVNFPTGKGVAYNTGKTFLNLTGQIVVTVTGNNAAGNPVSFQFFPTAIASGAAAAGQMVLSTSTAGSANTLIINPPTDLIYSKITALTPGSVTVRYLNLDNSLATDVLVGTIAAAPVVTAATETVSLPLTATATVNTLLTQSITGTLTGASSGSLVTAFLATWADNATTTPTGLAGNGRITSPGDKVATDLAIEYAGGEQAALSGLITTQLNPATAKPAVPGVSDAVKAGTVAPIQLFVKLVRSNDLPSSSKGAAATSSGSGNGQNYLEARAIVGTTIASVRGFGTANQINGVDGEDPVYEVNLDPRTGNITGRLTGNIRITQGTNTTASRGLTLMSPTPNARGLVDGTGRFNLLVGLDPSTATIASKGPAGAFLLLVHEDQANARRFTQLTSASPGAVNFVPFDPNLYNLKGTRTVLGAAPGIAAPFVGTGTAPSISLANYLVNDVSTISGNWMLMGLRNPAFSSANSAPANFTRHFVGIDSVTGTPSSYWTSDTAGADMALALTGNKMSLATELGTGGNTLTTFGSASAVNGAVAWAWNNDTVAVAGTETLTFAQGAPVTSVKVPRGWSLATVPTAGLTTASIDAVMKVGANSTNTQFTWIKTSDGALPTLTPGEAVFVFSAAGGGNL